MFLPTNEFKNTAAARRVELTGEQLSAMWIMLRSEFAEDIGRIVKATLESQDKNRSVLATIGIMDYFSVANSLMRPVESALYERKIAGDNGAGSAPVFFPTDGVEEILRIVNNGVWSRAAAQVASDPGKVPGEEHVYVFLTRNQSSIVRAFSDKEAPTVFAMPAPKELQ
jgi:hypothetical protein